MDTRETVERRNQSSEAPPARPAGLRDDESGAAAVEFALVTPVLLLLLLGFIQAAMLFFIQHEMNNAARETARRMSVGELATESAAETYANQRMATLGLTFTYVATFPASPSETDVSMQISVPMADAAFFDPFGLFQSGTMRASAAMRQE